MEKNSKLYLWNPLPYDVISRYDVKGDKVPVQFVVHSERISQFDDDAIGQHILHDLVEEVLNYRNIIHFDQNREEVRKEVIKKI